MAGSLILVPFYVCVLGLMLCGSVADSRAVFFRELQEPALPEEYGVDDGPNTFTMQDHFNYLRERELARRRGGDSTQLSTLATTSHVEEEEQQPIFVSDYCHTGANTKYGP
ncbi:hypothetical protein M758_1G257300 [Ceratodon purpureus]|uniref:Uncharacterized protein n=1 Tax=Ceratodon purpureus TaxID=3225 RepID=A0A8T0JA08_CERPU|nr:hypothetical protein KC19_1G263800 [Ceratodon purpureus]KAG0631487.1 hypothetical protein M758_1G257300 [Ceratodon purpureus]